MEKRAPFRLSITRFNYPLPDTALPDYPRAEDQGNPLRQPFPVGAFILKLPAPCARQTIELRVASCLRGFPLRLQPSASLEAVKSRIERSLLDLQDIFRDLLQPLRNGVAVERRERHHLQDQHVERALEKIGFRCRHMMMPRTSTGR